MKKFTALFLVFSLVMLSTNLYAKERRGAKLIITKKDGLLIEGELIAVKPNSLLLLNTEGKDVSVGIDEIKVIRVVKKSKAGKYALGGFYGVGIPAALLAGLAAPHDEDVTTGGWVLFVAMAGAVGALIGGTMGALEGKDKTIQIEGRSPEKINKILKNLRIYHARVIYY